MRELKIFRLICVGFLSLSSSLALAAHAKSEPTAADKIAKSGSPNTCVFANSIYDWQILDDTNLVLWAPNNRNAYLIRLTMPLIGVRDALRLAFVDRNHNGQLCGFGEDAIVTDDRTMPQKSTIHSMTRLDDAAIAELSAQYKINLSREHKKKLPKEPSAESAK